MCYEEKAEACHYLQKLLIIDDDLEQITRERLLVESCQVIRDEMVAMLQVACLNATEDMDMVTQVKGEVRKLCTCNIIPSQIEIVLNEADEMCRQNLSDMIYMSEEELKTLVHGMVAEQLNSSSWRHWVIACKILPALSGTVNKDIIQKLTELMWHDWHTKVWHAAAQCLGKTSHSRDVHDDLKRCIVHGSEKIIFEAISWLGQLALGKIGVQSDAIKDCLWWAMCYEEKAEACHYLQKLLIIDDDLLQITRECLLVESSQVIQDEMVAMLQVAGLNVTEDMDMVTQVKGEVRKLCTRNIIPSQIVLNKADEMCRQNLSDMIYMSEEELKAREEEHESSRRKLRDYLKSQERSFSATCKEPVSREAKFTPSADQKFEAIINQEEGALSWEASFVSQPFTSEADSASQAYSSPPTTTEQTSLRSAPEQSVGCSDDWPRGSATTADGGALIPGKSCLGITLSLHDLKERWGNILPSLPATASRDTVKEHEKIKEHVTRAYGELEVRYSEMEEELTKIDPGLDVGIPGLKGLKFLEIPKALAAQAEHDAQGVGVELFKESSVSDSSNLQIALASPQAWILRSRADSLVMDISTDCQPAKQDMEKVAVSLPVPSEGP